MEMTKELVADVATIDREITIVQTHGGVETITTSSGTLGQLKDLVDNEGIDINFRNMKIVNGETQHIYELDDTVLPSGDFTLFLMPVKNKSGAYVWENLGFFPTRAYIKGVIAQFGEIAEQHFNKGNKWSKDKTEALHAKLKEWETIVSSTTTTVQSNEQLVTYTTSSSRERYISKDLIKKELQIGVDTGVPEVVDFCQHVAEGLSIELDMPEESEEDALRRRYETMRSKFNA